MGLLIFTHQNVMFASGFLNCWLYVSFYVVFLCHWNLPHKLTWLIDKCKAAENNCAFSQDLKWATILNLPGFQTEYKNLKLNQTFFADKLLKCYLGFNLYVSVWILTFVCIFVYTCIIVVSSWTLFIICNRWLTSYFFVFYSTELLLLLLLLPTPGKRRERSILYFLLEDSQLDSQVVCHQLMERSI